jgi:AhpD family alkylhydroperoxidase
MPDAIYPQATPGIAQMRRDLAPEIQAGFDALGRKNFGNGALAATKKQIVAVDIAYITQYPYRIKGHTNAVMRAGAVPQKLMEAIWLATEMRAGGGCAHLAMMISIIEEERANMSLLARPAPPAKA